MSNQLDHAGNRAEQLTESNSVRSSPIGGTGVMSVMEAGVHR